MLMHIAPLLALTPEIKQELYPILLFLGMFAVVFGLGALSQCMSGCPPIRPI